MSYLWPGLLEHAHPHYLPKRHMPPTPYAVHKERPHTTSKVYQWHEVDCFLQKHNWWVFHNKIERSHNQLTVYQYYINLSSKVRWHPEGWVEVSPPTSAKGFVSENLSANSYRFFLRLPFVFFWGHRCILNLPCILRTGVVHFRSPSHQPSTSHHCVLCRWLGESRPALKLSIVSWSTILIEQSLIEVKRYVFYQ